MTTFSTLGLVKPIQRALQELKYEVPTPIQAQAIPPLLDGNDVLGCAQTGTGKTAAFTLPVLQKLASAPSTGKRQIRALILTPTRELAAQIGESIAEYGKFVKHKKLVIFGGVNENPQISSLRKGVDILVATPGRLLDLHGRGFVRLDSVEFFVLDEADRMLDMGFIHDVKKVLRVLPSQRQNLLFSATMPKSITQLANSFLKEPVQVEVTPQSTTVEKIEQAVYYVAMEDKPKLLVHLLDELGVTRAIVFTRTKHGANKLVKRLSKSDVRAVAIHGNKSQNARKLALRDFRQGKVPILVATDIAARGIDVDEVSHVFNYDMPVEAETYVHRIGRTGRAGRVGKSISFCEELEGGYLRDIQKLIGLELPAHLEHPYHCQEAVLIPGKPAKKRPQRQRTPRDKTSSRRPPSKNNAKRTSGKSPPKKSQPNRSRPGKKTNSRKNGPTNPGRKRPAKRKPSSRPKRSL